ncbi:hypothetical protein GCM10025782_01310 [Pedococcus ginsenosidimutans]|uniref:Uncharacterized protein n=1 Tax=Pedococcus ginsenosidimutans TaxID=490570 RepID=A0ABP8XK17_9MICO
MRGRRRSPKLTPLKPRAVRLLAAAAETMPPCRRAPRLWDGRTPDDREAASHQCLACPLEGWRGCRAPREGCGLGGGVCGLGGGVCGCVVNDSQLVSHHCA